jgi:hypothetical protein
MAVSDSKKRARRADALGDVQVKRSAALPAIGLEAEFATVIDGVVRKPEEVFGSPRTIVQGPMLHRTGRSYHLPTGGAVYFDTGVIELATPMIEIDRGCAARGTRSLWESLAFLRAELDGWERRREQTVRLVGFSAHYNVSFDPPVGASESGRTVERLAYLLTHVLAAPVMLLAANRRSTGVGVRPRGNRVEITADFTPDAGLMAATATLIVGIVRDVMGWPSYELIELERRGVPLVRGFVPEPHSSRKGWVAKDRCFPVNPFTSDPDDAILRIRTGDTMSLREMASRTTRLFWNSIRSLGDPLSVRLIGAVMQGSAPSLLELSDRPPAYDDVGRLCRWDDLFPVRLLPRSRYERVLSHAIAGRRVRMEGSWHRPVGVRGWTHVVLRRESDGARRIRSLDELLAHLGAWDRTADRRRAQRRRLAAATAREYERRALEERRVERQELDERRRSDDASIEQGDDEAKEVPVAHEVVAMIATEADLLPPAEVGAPPAEPRPKRRRRGTSAESPDQQAQPRRKRRPRGEDDSSRP